MFSSQMKAPGMTTTVAGRNKTLYMPSVASIEERTRANLKKTLKGRAGLARASLFISSATLCAGCTALRHDLV